MEAEGGIEGYVGSAAGVRTAPAESQSVGDLKSRQENEERKKRIEGLVKKLLDVSSRGDSADPAEAQRITQELELTALTEGKGRVGSAVVTIGYKMGYVTVEGKLKREKRRMEGVVTGYRRNAKQITKEMDSVARHLNKLKNERDEAFTLDSDLHVQIEEERGEIGRMEDEYSQLRQKPLSDQVSADDKRTVGEAIQDLREEARGKNAYVAELEQNKVENSINLKRIRKEIEATERQYESLNDRLDKNKANMYASLERVTPTTYAIRKIELIKAEHVLSAEATSSGRAIDGLVRVMEESNAVLETMSYESVVPSNGDAASAPQTDLQKKRDDAREVFRAQKENYGTEAESYRREVLASDSLTI